jgi:hypothetical protein
LEAPARLAAAMMGTSMQTPHNSTRRQAFGQPAAEDPHSAWHREWSALLGVWNAPDFDASGHDEETHPTRLRIAEFEELILGTVATTPAGWLAQIELALAVAGEGDPDHEPSSVEERALRALRVTLQSV